MNVCFIDIGGTNIRYSFFYNNKRLSIKKKEIPVSKSFNQILNEILKEKETIVTDLVISAAGPKFNQTIKINLSSFSSGLYYLQCVGINNIKNKPFRMK